MTKSPVLALLLTLIAFPALAEPGDVVFGFDAAGESPSGLGWDGSHIWVSYIRRAGSDEVDRLAEHDPVTGELVDEIAMPSGSYFHNLSFGADGSIWTDDLFRDVVRLDPDTLEEMTSFRGPGWAYGVTYVPELDALLLADFMTNELSRVELDGTLDRTIDLSIEDEMLSGTAWDGTHLWLIGGTSETIYRVDVNTGAVEDSFEVSSGASGLAWDGSCLWISDTRRRRIERVDHGQDDLVPCMAVVEPPMSDAGMPDAGSDAGSDAGPDAGPISDAGMPEPDAGSDDAAAPDPDAGFEPDAGFADAGTESMPRGDDGCSCSTSAPTGSVLPLLLMVFALRRRAQR